MRSPTPICLTGATGTVGRSVLARLRGDSHRIRVATRDPTTALARFGTDGVEYTAFDFTDPATYESAFEGVERLFLVRPPQITRAGRSILPAIDAAARAGVRYVVFLSVLGADRAPLVPHARIERGLDATDLSATFLRASYFMQNLSGVHRTDLAERDEVFVPAGGGETSLVDARDVAAVAARLLAERDCTDHADSAYALTGPEALTYAEVATVLSDVLDRPITYPDPSPLRFARRMRSHGHPLGEIAAMVGIYTVARLGLAGRVTADCETVLGRSPLTFEEYARDYAHCWQRTANGNRSG